MSASLAVQLQANERLRLERFADRRTPLVVGERRRSHCMQALRQSCVLTAPAVTRHHSTSTAPPQPRAPALPTQRVASKHGWVVVGGGVSGAAELRRLQ